VWGGTQDSTFLTSSQKMLVLLVCGPQLEWQDSQPCSENHPLLNSAWSISLKAKAALKGLIWQHWLGLCVVHLLLIQLFTFNGNDFPVKQLPVTHSFPQSCSLETRPLLRGGPTHLWGWWALPMEGLESQPLPVFSLTGPTGFRHRLGRCRPTSPIGAEQEWNPN
jgi:hypothetical protein